MMKVLTNDKYDFVGVFKDRYCFVEKGYSSSDELLILKSGKYVDRHNNIVLLFGPDSNMKPTPASESLLQQKPRLRTVLEAILAKTKHSFAL